MNPWYAPLNFSAWRRRLLSQRSVVLAVVIISLAATELRFDWVEQMLGGYLVTTNAFRPQSGAIWEQGQLADSARRRLAQVADQRLSMQREARQAGSMGQLVASIAAEKGAMISSAHFLNLYLKLPPVLANEIISPYALLTFANSGQWQRTFVEKQNQHLSVYLLDTRNQVIHRLTIGPDLIGHIERGEVAVQTSLDHLSDFAGQIYPAEPFFMLLNNFPAEVREKIVAHPEELLRVTGQIRRVGISDVDFGGAVDLGFEVDAPDGPKVIFMQGNRDEVRRLQGALESDASLAMPRGGEGRP